MLVLEAVRTAEAPAPVSPAHVLWEGDGDAAHAVIPGIEDALERAVTAHATFSELALPWARPADPAEAGGLLKAGGRPLAVLRTGAEPTRRCHPGPTYTPSPPSAEPR